jgi:endonuclease YncB( thermonuclease family)
MMGCAAMKGRWIGQLALISVLACDSGREPNTSTPPREGNIVLTIVGRQNLPMLGARVLASGRTYQVVTLKLDNGRTRSIPGAFDKFRLQTGTSGGAHRPAAESAMVTRPCTGEVASRGSTECNVAFETNVDQDATKLLYDGGEGLTAEAIFEIVAPVCTTAGPEDSLAACSDSCDNEGDNFTDCNDSSCCLVRRDCGPSTYCGINVGQCVNGTEASFARCGDACDNDGDNAMDCDDPECCAFVACAAGTYCAAQGDPFVSPVSFDDAAVDAINPAIFGGHPTPCRSPELVEVSYVRDGDTLEVFVPRTNSTEAVRLIGVDTPELAHEGQPLECYGPEARAFTAQFDNHRLWLTFDGVCTDMFGRTLAYAFYGSEGHQMLQRQLIRRGFGEAYAFSDTRTYEAQLASDEAEAIAKNAGLHAACP